MVQATQKINSTYHYHFFLSLDRIIWLLTYTNQSKFQITVLKLIIAYFSQFDQFPKHFFVVFLCIDRYFSGIFLAYAKFAMIDSNINDITTETINKATANEDLDNLILNAIKSIRNFKKRPDCSVIYNYLIRLLPILRLTKKLSQIN